LNIKKNQIFAFKVKYNLYFCRRNNKPLKNVTFL